jgi:hypothetical protein
MLPARTYAMRRAAGGAPVTIRHRISGTVEF